MSGAVAAHAAYNGSGTQGLAVTNKINEDDGDVMSVFWNKNDTTRQLLHGSSIIEIPASGSGGNLTSGGNQVFTINNDIDALGDLYLQITTSGISASTSIKAFDLLYCVKRIEFMVGTQVWQTLEAADIAAMNATELSEDAFESYILSMSGGFTKVGTRNGVRLNNNPTPGSAQLYGETTGDVTGVLRIPALSRSFGPKLAKFTDVSENCYLLAGAPHQAVKVRVYMASFPASLQSVDTVQLKLFGQCVVMCNEEREQIKEMPMGLPKRLKMTQNAILNVVPTVGTAQVVNLDLDHFSLFASHIILHIKPSGTVTNVSIDSAELKLNSSSFSGTLEGNLLTGPMADALGLYSNGFFINSAHANDSFYIFPLASHAYSGSSVPLNRFDNIRMELSVIAAGTSTTSPFTVTATCVGETTALYKGGAASLAMY